MQKLNNFWASLFKIPVSEIESRDETESTDSKPNSSKPALFDKKMLIIGSLCFCFLLGSLWISRVYHQRYNPVQVAPNDPNLYKTVKTDQRSPSILASVEDELSKKKLNAEDTITEDVQLIARKFSIKPSSEQRHSKLMSKPEPVQSPPPLPKPVIEPVKPFIATTYNNHRSTPKRGTKTRLPVSDSAIPEPVDEAFNTIRFSPTSGSVVNNRTNSESVKYIPAAIYGNQRIRTGGKARFRTTEAVTFQGVYIPKNTIISTVVFLGNGRIQFQAPAPMIAGQRLLNDLMCVDKDFSLGITYNYDIVEDNMRQSGVSTASNAASAASSVLRYSSPVASIATDAVRGIANGVINGKRQKSITQVEILDGYQVFFKSTK